MGPILQELSKFYTGRTKEEAVCLALLLFYVIPRHTNIMIDKVFNLFDESASTCVHLSPQEKDLAYSDILLTFI